jgi:hypothetical protein
LVWVFFLYHVSPVLPVSLDCTFLIAPLVFSWHLFYKSTQVTPDFFFQYHIILFEVQEIHKLIWCFFKYIRNQNRII